MYLIIKKKFRRFLLKFKFFRKILFKYKSLKRLKIFDKLNLNNNSLFIDIGSHEGIFSFFFVDKFNCNVEIYEPNKKLYKLLLQNFKNYKKVKLFNLAVSNKSGKNKLYLHKKSNKNNHFFFDQSSSLEKNKDNVGKNNFQIIQTINIKKILDKHKFIDVIKIDIEGHEYKILDILLLNINKIGKIYCELNGDKKYPAYAKQKKFWIKKLKKLNILNKKFIEFS
jgi:FkbM family methyltransferase